MSAYAPRWAEVHTLCRGADAREVHSVKMSIQRSRAWRVCWNRASSWPDHEGSELPRCIAQRCARAM